MSVDTSGWELHNFAIRDGAIRGRRGFVSHRDAANGEAYVGGFSIRSANTDEVWHYIVGRATSGQGTLTVYNEEFQSITSKTLGPIPNDATITSAVQLGQILINSPEFSNPIYGLVGGGITNAVAQAGANELNQPHLSNIPNGYICGFGNRPVIAQGRDVFFGSIGTATSSVDIRTFTSGNILALPAPVKDMMEAEGVGLYFITTAGVWVLPTDALGVGEEVQGQLAKVSDYGAARHHNAAISKNQVFVLTRDGVTNASTGQDIPLTLYSGPRSNSRPVGATASGDFRTGTIWPTRDGVVVSIEGKLCFVDAQTGRPLWFYNQTEDFKIVGMCRSRDGKDLIITPSRIMEYFGNWEFITSADLQGVACGPITSSPQESPVIRSISTASDNVGLSQAVYISGKAKSAITPASPRALNVIGTNTWGQAGGYLATPDRRSRRHLVEVRTNTAMIEVSITGSDAVLDALDIEVRGKAPRRP